MLLGKLKELKKKKKKNFNKIYNKKKQIVFFICVGKKKI